MVLYSVYTIKQIIACFEECYTIPMRHNFEKNLKTYNEAVKESCRDLSKEGKEKSGAVKESLTSATAQESHTDKEAEIEIYTIQKQKLERLNKFKKFLEKTRTKDGGFEHAVMNKEGNIAGTVTQKDGEFFVVSKDGTKQPITISEIMTDGEWGVEYTFDDSVNIHDIRSYYLEALKSDLREKLDAQIIISEINNSWVDTRKKDAYQKIEERLGKENHQEGVVAEKMVKNFLKKLSIDTDADFEIVDADVYQDVEQKIDFIIRRKAVERNRGVGVEESKDVGIQFTTALGKSEHKERQIEKSKRNLEEDIDDIVLVSLPAYQASALYRVWSQNKKPGGPEKMWGSDVQETLFRGVMDKVLSPEEIDEFCQNNFQKKQKTA